MDLKTKSLQELKAYAYDLLVQQEVVAMNLQAVNNEISEKVKEERAKEEKKIPKLSEISSDN